MATSGEKELSVEEASKITKQKVMAAKQYIENHYKEQMKSLHDRRERTPYFTTFLDENVSTFFLFVTGIRKLYSSSAHCVDFSQPRQPGQSIFLLSTGVES
ncbi:hypothetical protein LIER_34658 [Lithospermum erythrorhizon]|uniref:Uncharacterized protein n=1 Tax=Lithospermum erythrorhizon TaxID=34254 RepID=A0AAV3S344_LITER